MVRRVSLPLSAFGGAAHPTVDAMRKRLGGRASTEAGAGEIVSLADDSGARFAVVLFVERDVLHVTAAPGIVRKISRTAAALADGPAARASGPPSGEIAALAVDARAFAELVEGQRVTYSADTARGEGTLVEKCRFGALVLRDDGTIVGVGFRRVRAPAPAAPGVVH